MKIALIAPMDPRTGISNYSETLALELLNKGQKVDIVSPENSQNSRLTSMDKMKHVKPENYHVEDYDVTHFQLANSPLHEFQFHMLYDHKNDLINNSSIITTVHDARNFDLFDLKCTKCIKTGLNLPKSLLTYPYDVVDRGFQRVSNGLIFHNNSALEEYQTRYNLSNKILNRILHPAYRIPGINDYTHENSSLIKTMLAPGYISPYKGQDILIRAAANVDMDFKLIFMGKILDMGYGEYLKDLVEEHGLENKVEFLGFVTEEEFISNIDNAEVILVPRLSSPWLNTKPLYRVRKLMGLDILINQSTSGVLTKALASGKPVICSENQGFMDYIDNSRGIMCRDDEKSWSEAIKYILENPNKVKDMSNNSRKFADDILCPSKIAEDHIEFYKKFQ